jgi:hypothetical protein
VENQIFPRCRHDRTVRDRRSQEAGQTNGSENAVTIMGNDINEENPSAWIHSAFQ